MPRLPLEASVDLTYRCTNQCRHCWLWTADTAAERAAELTTDEWREVVDQARALGTRRWSISGGEPMLRDDFAELFDYMTRKAVGYTLNTNGALITPEIAQLLTRKGTKMIAVYGATAEVFDRVTRTPGSFEATMEGFARLKEAGAGFVVQLIPMRANWHEWQAMQELARSLSPHWRVGAAWLFMTACGDPKRNAEIARQRLEPADAVALDKPIPTDEPTPTDEPITVGEPLTVGEPVTADDPQRAARPETADAPFSPDGPVTAEEQQSAADDRIYAGCLAMRRDLHVDPYGGVAHCSFVKDPSLRFGLRAAGAGPIRTGALERIWEESIPSVGDACRGGTEYLEGCGSCDLRNDCRWCDVYAYLEHRRHGAKVEYLCEVAKEARRFKDEWRRAHRRTWQIGGMTIRVDSDRPIADDTFSPKFRDFEAPPVGRGGADGGSPDRGADGHPVIRIRHHFGLPDLDGRDLGDEVYRRAPWAISRLGSSWVYLGITPNSAQVTGSGRTAGDGRSGTAGEDGGPGSAGGGAGREQYHRVVTFSDDHTRARIYNDVTHTDSWARGGLTSVTMFPTDQILLARVLADRDGLFLHSGAVVLGGAGLCFVGHSEAGKSTTMSLLRDELGDRVEVLCDDRNIVRYWDEGPPPVPSQAVSGEDSDGAGRTRGEATAEPGFWVHGTWSHGTVPIVSASQAPLRAIVFPKKDTHNELVRITDGRDLSARLVACTIRPFVTADWWHKTFDVLERLAATVPAYEMCFDKSGAIVSQIEELVRRGGNAPGE